MSGELKTNWQEGDTGLVDHLNASALKVNAIESSVGQLQQVVTPAQLAIGTVESGSAAAATIDSGVLNLVLPPGPEGPAGPTGPAGPDGSAQALASSFLSAVGGKIVFDDNFQRPDQTLASGGNGVLAPTGQRYRSEGTVHSDGSDAAVIVNKRHVWADQTTIGSDPIRILDAALTQTPNAVGGEFVFVAGTSNRQNAVIGCMTTDSFNVASIQLAVYPTKWRLFWVTDSTQADVALENFTTPLIVDGKTRHQIFLRRDPASSTVVAECNGQVLYTWTDPKVLDHWGKFVGFQERLEVAGDGSVEWTHIAASSPESAPSGLNAALSFVGSTDNYVRCNLSSFAPSDLQIIFHGTPSGGWASGKLQALASKWSGATSQKSWSLSLYTGGQLQFFMTTDGSTETHCTSAAVNAASTWVKAAYDSSAATVLFSESTDGVTWTTIGTGAVAIANAGVPFAGPDYIPVTIGNRDNNSSFVYDGTVSRVEISDTIGGSPVAVADLSVVRGASWYDDNGVQWAIAGDWTWSLS